MIVIRDKRLRPANYVRHCNRKDSIKKLRLANYNMSISLRYETAQHPKNNYSLNKTVN